MASNKQRIEALEKKLNSNKGALFIVIDGDVTDEQQRQIDEARSINRPVVELSPTDLLL